MVKVKMTLETLATRIDGRFAKLEAIVGKGFAAVAGDITDIKNDITDIKSVMATKDQIAALHTQVTSIESDIRGMKQAKLEFRVTDLEEKVFGKIRA
jgi:hypothetical protein